MPQKADNWAFDQELTAKKVYMGVHMCVRVYGVREGRVQ